MCVSRRYFHIPLFLFTTVILSPESSHLTVRIQENILRQTTVASWKMDREDMGVSKNTGGPPQIINLNRVFQYKPYKPSILDHFRVPLFLETPICRRSSYPI